jgi:triphosphatase
MATEIELKFATSRGALREAARLPWVARMAAGKTKVKHLKSVYYDTDGFALRNHHVSLRVRLDGAKRLQTIKSDAANALERNEWEDELDGDRPLLHPARHTALAHILTSKIERELAPVFETTVRRILIPLLVGASEIELALDAGRISVPDEHANIAEIEIELKRGSRRDLAHVARRLARSLPLSYGAQSKSERGYALLEGTIMAAVAARHVALARSVPVEDAFVAIGLECLRHIAANEAAVHKGDPEGVHQMRVAARRFRAAFSIFKSVLQDGESRKIKRELGWLGEQLAPARDIDVFISDTVDPVRAGHPDHPEFAPFARELQDHRKARLAAARAAVDSERFRRLLLDCPLWLLDGDWRSDEDALGASLRRRPARQFARLEMQRRLRKIVKRSRKLSNMPPQRRHKLRIAVKKLRYAHEFFQDLSPDNRPRKKTRKVVRELKALQSTLGNLNDMQVHADWARHSVLGSPRAQRAFAAGYLVRREEARSAEMLDRARLAGKRLRQFA